MNKKAFELITIPELFDFGNRFFCVPDYQRGYSWEEEQRKDLIRDIEYIIEGKYTHYTGTIVATKGEDDVYEIVDGQQRLTTLVILLSVICNSYIESNLPSNEIKDIRSTYLFKNELVGTTEYIFKLQTEHNLLFMDLIKNKEIKRLPKTKSEENLLDAFDEFNLWLQTTALDRVEIFNAVTKKLGFLFYTPSNTSEIGIMFEVINNRGKSLSELEKVKNYLIYFADKNGVQDLKANVKAKWGGILENLNKIGHNTNNQENSFLRNCWIVFEDSNKSKSHYVYDNLKENYPVNNIANWQRLNGFVDFLFEASLTYRKLFIQEEVEDIDEKEQLQLISLQPQIASIIPLVISLYSQCSDAVVLSNYLKLIEKLNFRYYVLNVANRSDSGQGIIFSISHRLYNDINFELQDFYNSIVYFIRDRVSDLKFIEYLTLDKDEQYDYYQWQGLKFFFANYENHLKNKLGETADFQRLLAVRDKKHPNNFYHREHIFAVKDFSVINDEHERNINKRRLGNFILLKETQNIKVSNNRPEIKVDLYWKDRDNDPNTLMIRELKGDFTSCQDQLDVKWTRKTKNYWYELYQSFFDKREKKLIDFALDRWRVSELPDENKVSSVRIDSFSNNNEVYFFNK